MVGRTTLAPIVSIHAPREGCDTNLNVYMRLRATFQFTHPGRGATIPLQRLGGQAKFQFTHPGRGAT